MLIATHNDGTNIATLLARLLAEPGVGEIMVVASGCDDDTVPLVAEAPSGDDRVQLFVEAERSGKVSAVNFGLGQVGLPNVVIVSGDVMPSRGAIGLWWRRCSGPASGLAGGRPVPDNSERRPSATPPTCSGACTTAWPCTSPSWAR